MIGDFPVSPLAPIVRRPDSSDNPNTTRFPTNLALSPVAADAQSSTIFISQKGIGLRGISSPQS